MKLYDMLVMSKGDKAMPIIPSPDSKVTFYSGVEIIPGEQTLAFHSQAGKNAYFASKKVCDYTNLSRIRKDGKLKIDSSVLTPADALECNYLSFVNPQFGDKIFYGFITDIEYENEGVILVSWVIDWFMSYSLELGWSDMTIEREHLSQATYANSLTNPYDPTILENRTMEYLPIGTDIEKPYYDIENGTDGFFIGEKICDTFSVDNRAGVLIALSDMDLKSKDSGTPAGSSAPSSTLYTLLTSTITAFGDVSFCVLSPSTFAYFNSLYTPLSSRTQYTQNKWLLGQTQLYPLAGSRITPPITYVYIDGGITPVNENDTRPEYLGNLLTWLTEQGFTDSIIGMYPVTTGIMLMSGSSVGHGLSVSLDTASGQTRDDGTALHNTKLDLYPFSYYRLVSPAGDVKELKIEDFMNAMYPPENAQSGDDKCHVTCAFDAISSPSLTVAPEGYRLLGSSPHLADVSANVLESLVFEQFPTLPYAINGWLAQMAANANNLIANRTTEYLYNAGLSQIAAHSGKLGVIREGLSAAGDLFSGTFGGGVGDFANAIFGGFNTILSGHAQGLIQDKINLEANMMDDATKVFEGNEDNAVYDNFKCTRPAYANNHYFRSNGSGTSNFLHISFCDILFMRTALNPAILTMYDDYLDRYGLSSGRIGVPRICAYLDPNGSSQATDLPHWVDGYTFVKTANCSCEGVPKPVMDTVNAMFNSGIRFKKVDDPT